MFLNTYKIKTPRARYACVLSALVAAIQLCLLLPITASAQTTSPPRKVPAPEETRSAAATSSVGASAPKAGTDYTATDGALTLTAFEVRADSDSSYGALNSNSITSFNTELTKLPISANIFTETFMRDVAAISVEEMIRGYVAGAGMAFSDPSSVNNQPGDKSNDGYVALRGLTTPTQQRDGFLPLNGNNTASSTAVGYTDNFDIERVEVINGPQALLYGMGGGGGVINMVGKRARFDKRRFGSTSFQIDQYGSKRAVFDFGFGKDKMAIRLAAVNAKVANRRVNVGGPLAGYYIQFAYKIGQDTVVRFSGDHTWISRNYGTSPAFTALSAANDSRNGQSLHYLLATNQLKASATGASGAGDLGSAIINWSNVDSLFGPVYNERAINTITTLAVETKWSRWLSSQFSVGYKNFKDKGINTGATFYAPNNPNNPLGVPALALVTATSAIQDVDNPARTKAIRFSLLATNALFSGRAHSETIIGADFSRVDSAYISYNWYQADSNFNLIVNPAVPANAGRTPLPGLYAPLSSAPTGFSWWSAHADHLTYNGVNYVHAIANPVNQSAISAENPLGVTLGGLNYYIAKNLNKAVYGANTTQWFGGRLTTLAGFRLGDFLKVTQFQGIVPTANDPTSHATKSSSGTPLGYNIGANFAATSWLRPYVSISSSYNPPVSGDQANDLYGNPPKSGRARGEEAGVKFQNAKNTISGSLAIYHINAKNEVFFVSSTLLNAVNPNGLNGRYGAASVFINVDRKSDGAQLDLTATPTRNWRSRFSAAYTEGKIGTGTTYNQLYNDQFYANSQGQITYKDGTPVYVPAAVSTTTPVVTATTPGAIPLTLAVLNSASSPYYANPLAITGQLNNANLTRVLRVVDPAHGAILTGVTGLPISQIQINPGFTPAGAIAVSRPGDLTTGYPKISMNFTNAYTFESGWAKDLRVGGTVGLAWQSRRYYYYTEPIAPDAKRAMFFYPDQSRFDLLAGYTHRFRSVTWSSQLNVNNLFNHYKIVITPNGATGFLGTINATFDQQPRFYQFTNTVSF